jgi:hypothetical protein
MRLGINVFNSCFVLGLLVSSSAFGDDMRQVSVGDDKLWEQHLPAFSKEYRVIAYSRRNHFPNSTSNDGLPDGAADAHGEDLAAFLTALGVKQAHIVAHSSGAHAVLFFASNHPEMVRTAPSPTQTPALAGPAGGLITNFTSAKYNLFQIDSVDYDVLTVANSYSLEEVDNHTLRFEIRQGDSVWCCNNETSEVQREPKWTPATPVTIEYQFMLEPGATSTASWFVVGEIHNDDSAWPQGTSPPFAMQITPGDYLQVVARYITPGGNPTNGAESTLVMLTPWTASSPIVRGQWYDIKIQANISNPGGGYLRVWVNGMQVVNYNGKLGYGYDTYWMYGLYRDTSPQDTAAQYRNMTVTTP